MKKLKSIYLWAVVLAACLIVLIVSSHASQAAQPAKAGTDGGEWLPGFHIRGTGQKNGIFAMADDGTNLYAGGDFTYLGGQNFNGIAKYDGSSWTPLGNVVYNPFNVAFEINTLVWTGTDLIAAGDFSIIDGVEANNIARWDGTNWQPLGIGPDNGVNDDVFALAWDGTYLYAGGNFSSAGGVAVNNIARWDGTNWEPLGSGTFGVVNDIIWDGSDLYVGGAFSTAGGVTAFSVARWDGASWHALGSGVDFESYVSKLFKDGPDLYVGGSFTMAGGIAANKIARWDGSAWSALDDGIDGNFSTVTSIEKVGSDIVVGGSFDSASGTPADNVAKWNGSAWQPFGGGVSGTLVREMHKMGNALFFSGFFSVVNGDTPAMKIAKWENDVWSAVLDGAGISGTVFSLEWNGVDLFAGGNFNTAGGVVAHDIARWNGSSWAPLGSGNSDPNASVWTLEWADGNLFAGGQFQNMGGVSAANIARWDGSVWTSLGSGLNDEVLALAWDGTYLYAGGEFTTAGGVSANHVARWDGSVWTSLGSGMDGTVQALFFADGNLYAGGAFTIAGGSPANYIARWDGGSWSPLGSGTNDEVTALEWDGANLFAGGEFTQAGGNTANHVAMWNGGSWSQIGIGVSGGSGSNFADMVWNGTDLFVIGRFSFNNIARWDGNQWFPLGDGLDDYGRAGAWVEDRLFVGGQFERVNESMPSHKMAVWSPVPDFDIQASPTNIAVCPGIDNDPVYDIDLISHNNFTDTVTLNAIGNPTGTTAVFGQNPINPPDTTTMTISDTIDGQFGIYPIDIVGVSTTQTHTATVSIYIQVPAPTVSPTLTAPANGATGVPNLPTLSWTTVPFNPSYNLEVATDAAFNNIVFSTQTALTSHTILNALANGTEHFWRVTAENQCGSGPQSAIFSFTTAQVPTPDVAVSPGDFNIVLEAGGSTMEILTIDNNGTADLDWSLNEDLGGSCTSSSEIPWLDIAIPSGTTPPAGRTNVVITFDASALVGGNYSGSICLASNDPDMPLINIPVTMTVIGGDYQIFMPAVLRG